MTEFPTLILFDSQVKAIRTVIGFSWLEAPALYATQERLIKGQSIDLDIVNNIIFSIVMFVNKKWKLNKLNKAAFV